MKQDWAGRVAIVTGGSRGIGNGIARRFAELGASVVITSRRQEAADAAAVALEGDVVGIAAPAADEEAAQRCIESTVSRWGRLDVLVNNVGRNFHVGPIQSVDRSRFDKMIETNLWAPMMWTRCAVAAGLGRGADAAIVNVSSNISMAPSGGVYGMTKAALNYVTQQLAVELAPSVRVNAVAPGVVDTDMAAPLIRRGRSLCAGWPLPRYGMTADVADAAEFLAGPGSSWMTGQVLVLDGGARLVSLKEDIAGAFDKN